MQNETRLFKGGLSNRKVFFLLIAVWLFAILTSRPISIREPFRYGSFIEKDISQINSSELHINFYYLVFQNPYNAQAHLYLKKYIEAHPEDGPDKNGGVSHLLKRNIRVGIPIIANLFHLEIWQLYLLQFLVAFVFLLLLYKTVLLINSGNKDLAFWFSLAFACSIIFKQFFIDPGHWDVYAWFFMMLSIWLALKGQLIFAIPFAFALLTDERSFFSIPVIGLLISYHTIGKARKNLLLIFFVGCIIALIPLAVWRYHFTSIAGGRDISGISLNYILYNSKAIASSLFLCYEFLWLLVYAVFFSMIRNRMYKQVSIILLSVLPALLITYMVADLARSIGYLFPFFILLYQQYQRNSESFGIIQIKHVAILNVIFPSYYPYLYDSSISNYPPFWGYYEVLLPIMEKIANFFDHVFL